MVKRSTLLKGVITALTVGCFCLMVACQTTEVSHPVESAGEVRQEENSRLTSDIKKPESSQSTEASKRSESSSSATEVSKPTESLPAEDHSEKIKIGLDNLRGEDGVFIFPGLRYGMTPQGALAALEADTETQPEKPFEGDPWKRETYCLGSVILCDEEFSLNLVFYQDQLCETTLELEAAKGQELGEFYDNLRQQLCESYGLGQERWLESVKERRGRTYDFQRFSFARSSLEDMNSPRIFLCGYEDETLYGGREMVKIVLSMEDTASIPRGMIGGTA